MTLGKTVTVHFTVNIKRIKSTCLKFPILKNIIQSKYTVLSMHYLMNNDLS